MVKRIGNQGNLIAPKSISAATAPQKVRTPPSQGLSDAPGPGYPDMKGALPKGSAVAGMLGNAAVLRRFGPQIASAQKLMETLAADFQGGRAPQLETKQELMRALSALDEGGVLEPALGKLIDTMIAAGKLPADLAPKRDMLIGLAATSVRAEAWVLLQPGFESWPRLAEKLLPKVGTTPIGAAGFVEEFSRLTRSQFVDGNKVDCLAKGPEFTAAVTDLIKNTSGPLFLNYWGIYDDVTGAAVKDLLLEAKARGVEIHIIVDGKTSAHHGGHEILPALEAAGVDVVRWQDTNNPPVGNHIKFITDGKTTVAGGSNLGDAYTHLGEGAKWSDSNIKITGPVAQNYVKLFKSLYKTGGGDQRLPRAEAGAVAGDDRVSLIETRANKDHQVLAAILKVISGAQKTLQLNQAYFIMTPPIEAALRAAIQRGVKVELLTNSHTSVDEPAIAEAILISAKRLLQIGHDEGKAANVSVYLKQGDTLHDKTVVADGQITLDMSYNLHPRSEWLEYEIATATLGEKTAKTHTSAFDDLKKNGAVKVTDPAQIPIDAPGADDFMREIFRNVL